MIYEPMDIDRYWPNVLTRDEALDMLQGLLPARDAELVWERIVAPLYDERRAKHKWPGGRCHCGARHPAFRFGPPRRMDEHRMWCRNYVGPLEHFPIGHDMGITGEPRSQCKCGKTYSLWVTDEARVEAVCPDILLVWRGPRPLQSKEDGMTNPQPDEQETQDQEQSLTEEERLARLREKGQVQGDAEDDNGESATEK